jgi:hypothetical protein
MSTGTEARTAKCRRCKRVLRTAPSIAAGIGPRCAAIEAAFDGLNVKQQDKARELVADGGITRTAHNGVCRVTAADGSEQHLTSVNGNCTCAWGLRRKTASTKPCYHVGAVRLAITPRLTLAA